MTTDFPKLDPREQHFRIPGPNADLALFLRYLPAERPAGAAPRPVLYVHGATFPSALSIGHRFDGVSWRDALNRDGFDVWGLDFQGFGCSDRYPEMAEPGDAHAPLCLAEDAARQVEAAVRFILDHQKLPRLSLISHSWGSMPAGRVAGRCAELIDRWVLFGPIARRSPDRAEPVPPMPAWRVITNQAQWDRFIEDVPKGEPPVLSRRHFDDWAERYLELGSAESDARSDRRENAYRSRP